MFRMRDVCRTSVLGLALALAMSVPVMGVHAAGFKILHTFQGGSDGAYPTAALIADNAGNLYSSTSYGGGSTSKSCLGKQGCGTIFKLAPDGTVTVLYAFKNRTDGDIPTGIVADGAGNFYGTTAYGGTKGGCKGHKLGCGNAFKLAPDGTKTTLYTFAGRHDGATPYGSLIEDGAGDLYGTTAIGGGAHGCGKGCGTVYRLAPDGTETVLHAFFGGGDGSIPLSGMVADSTGNLFGTTRFGGNACTNGGCGTIFRLAPDGTEKVLHAFNCQDGCGPLGNLIEDDAGNLYGTTVGNGDNGTVFKLASDGTFTTLYVFRGDTNGYSPQAGVTMDKAGNLYGTTYYGGGGNCGGATGCGVVFKLARNGSLTVLHAFTGGSDGALPVASLLLLNGWLYGTAEYAGANGVGTIFRVKP